MPKRCIKCGRFATSIVCPKCSSVMNMKRFMDLFSRLSFDTQQKVLDDIRKEIES